MTAVTTVEKAQATMLPMRTPKRPSTVICTAPAKPVHSAKSVANAVPPTATPYGIGRRGVQAPRPFGALRRGC